MPGRDYTRAYALFEQSLGDSFLSQPYQNRDSYVADFQDQDSHPATTMSQKTLDNRIGQSRTDMRTPPISAYRDKDLPPTPPSNTRSNKSSAFTNSTPLSYSSRVANMTPVDPKPLLTPDTTPHESSEGLNGFRSGSQPLASPYPESFRTAVEEQWSPYTDANRSRYFSAQSLRSAALHQSSGFYQASKSSSDVAQNVNGYPKQRSDLVRHTPFVSSLTSILANSQADHMSSTTSIHREPDLEIPKASFNFGNQPTVRAKTPTSEPFIPHDDSIPILMRGLSQSKGRHFKRQSPRSSLEGILEKSSPPSATTSSRRDGEYKRYSSVSNTSTVVQAYIYDSTPPLQKKKLRHSPKTGDLRDKVLQNDGSDRDQDAEDHTPTRSLHHKSKRLPSKQERSSIGSEASVKTDQHALIHKNQALPSREDRGSAASDITAETEQHALVHKDQPLPSRQERGSASSERSTRSAPRSLIHKDQQLPSRQDPSSADSQHLVKSPLDALNGLGIRESHQAPDQLDSSYLKTFQPFSQIDEFSEHNVYQQSSLLFPYGSSSGQRVYEGLYGGTDYASIDTADARRPSDDRSASRLQALSLLSHRRKGSSPGSFRPPDLGSTPLSFQSEALSVNEATAVNIYPHHNDSLLVVEHSPTTINPLHQHPVTFPTTSDRFSIPPRDSLSTELPRTSFPIPPTITVNTNTVPNQLAPPTFSIIPPTPNDEVDMDDSVAALDKPLPTTGPTRRTSMLKRARQYSDSIFQPLITFTATNTGSLRRSITVRKYYWNNRRRVSASKHADLVDKDGNLHAFWQPRAFWEGMSSDGSHDEEDMNHDHSGEHDCLPAGGDTSDVPISEPTPALMPSTTQPPPFSKWRLSGRGGSFRGFLIGNSLGIERGPTNRRRHVVRWPTGRKKRRIAGEMGGSGPKTMLVEGPRSQSGSMASLAEPSSSSAVVLRQQENGTGLMGPRETRGLIRGWRKRIGGGGGFTW